MKKTSVLLFCLLFAHNISHATTFGEPALLGYPTGYGYKYIDGGGIYTDVTTPFDVSNAVNNNNSSVDLAHLKRGESSKSNWFWLIEHGDASIYKAAKEANIEKIYYVDVKKEKVFIPLLFFPILVTQYTTTVYGE